MNGTHNVLSMAIDCCIIDDERREPCRELLADACDAKVAPSAVTGEMLSLLEFFRDTRPVASSDPWAVMVAIIGGGCTYENQNMTAGSLCIGAPFHI